MAKDLEGTASIIDKATNKVTDQVYIGENTCPYGLAVNPSGTKVYVTNSYRDQESNGIVSVIYTKTNKVTANVPVGNEPIGVAVTGKNVYVTNQASNTVSVINTKTNKVTATVPV